MRWTTLLAFMLLAGAHGSASVCFFLTDQPGMVGADTFNGASAELRNANYIPYTSQPKGGPFTQLVGETKTYWLWAKITRDDLPNQVVLQVYCLDFRGSGVTGGAAISRGVMYRPAYLNLPPNQRFRRWDGTLSLLFPGLAVAVIGQGIEAPANPRDLADDVGGVTYALIGAIEVTGTAPGTVQFSFGETLICVRAEDNLGNSLDWDAHPGNRYPRAYVHYNGTCQPMYDPDTADPPYRFDVVQIVAGDTDGDGLSDTDETSIHGTGPGDPDSDDDGLLDGTEVDMAMGSGCPSPLNADSDGDTLSDGAEVALGTMPCNADTDGDLVPDNLDPDPTVPGETNGVMEIVLRAEADAVSELSLAVIEGGNDNARAGRRNAMSNMVTAAANALAAYNPDGAIAHLESLAKKVDGDPTPPDWMVAGPERDDLSADIALLTAVLEQL